MRHRIISALCAMGFSLVMLKPLLAQDVNTDYDKTSDFSQYKTYAWAKGTPAANPLMDQRIVSGIDTRMAAKGLTKVDDLASADLAVAYHAGTSQQTRISTYGTGGWGYGYRWGGMGMTTTNIDQIPIGQLVVDMADVKGKKFVWRGTASGTVSDKPEKNEKTLDKALTKMFEEFPPPPAKAD